jgi:hypothetical protein
MDQRFKGFNAAGHFTQSLGPQKAGNQGSNATERSPHAKEHHSNTEALEKF